MERIKAAIFDVDGTLFDYRERKLHDSTVRAVRELKEKGIAVVVATARSYAELSEELLSRIGADYYVAASGQCIQDAEGRSLFSKHFTYEQTERVRELAVKYDVGLTLKYERYNCLYSHPEQMQRIFTNIGQPRCPSLYCPAMDRHETELPIGFAILGENGTRELVCRELERYPGDYRMERYRNGIVADIYDPHTNKMTALEQLVRRLGIRAGECIAFGDGGNDVEMIRWAGMGVAMGNACDELKAAADAVCGPSWEDGIAAFLSCLWQK